MNENEVKPLSPEEIAELWDMHANRPLNGFDRCNTCAASYWPCITARILATLDQSTANFEKLKAMYQEDSTILESLRSQLAEAVEAREAQRREIERLKTDLNKLNSCFDLATGFNERYIKFQIEKIKRKDEALRTLRDALFGNEKLLRIIDEALGEEVKS